MKTFWILFTVGALATFFLYGLAFGNKGRSRKKRAQDYINDLHIFEYYVKNCDVDKKHYNIIMDRLKHVRARDVMEKQEFNELVNQIEDMFDMRFKAVIEETYNKLIHKEDENLHS